MSLTHVPRSNELVVGECGDEDAVDPIDAMQKTGAWISSDVVLEARR